MIRAVAIGKDGPVIFLGITEGNVDRLMKGQPLMVDLGALIKEAALDMPDEPARLSLAITYQETHADVLAEWEEHGIPITDEMRKAAAEIDARP